MAEQKVLNDLIAAIQGDPSSDQNQAFPGVNPVQGVPIAQFPGQVPSQAANPLIAAQRRIPGQAQVPGRLPSTTGVPAVSQVPAYHHGRTSLAANNSKDANLIELENLLGNRSSSAPTARPATTAAQRMFPQQNVPRTSAQQNLQLGGAYAAQGLHQNITTRQLANAKVIQRQRAVSATMNAARQAVQGQANSAPQRARDGLAAQMNAGMARNMNATNAANTHAQRVSNGTARTAQRQGGRNPSSNQRASQNHPTQEQVIVGHFCRHAIKTLTKVMENDPRAADAEKRLRDHIKTVWAKWVRQMITRPQLLESVAGCVRESCEAAARIDVIREFKAWYEREYERQKQRTDLRAREQAKVQAEMARRGSVQNPLQAMRAQAVAAAGKAGAMGSAGMQAKAGNRAGLTTKQSAQLMLARNMQANPGNRAGLTANQGAQLISSTGGKGLASKTIPGKHTAVRGTVAGKTLAGRGIGRGVPVESHGGKSITRAPSSGKVAAGSGRGQAIHRAVGAGRGTAVGKAPALGRGIGIGKSPAAGGALGQRGAMVNAGIPGDGVMGGKGLLSSKSPGAKSKASRKTVSKGPAKAVSKDSPRSAGARPKPPPADPAAFVNHQGVPGMVGSVVGKRPHDTSGMSPQGPLVKKSKPPSVVGHGAAARKKPPASPASPSTQKGKPPPARPEMFRGKQIKRPVTSTPGGHVANAMGKGLPPGQSGSSHPPPKKPRRAGDGMEELSVVRDIVDIEDEEDKLGIDAGAETLEVQEVFDYGADMLLAGPRLRTKMQAITKRVGLEENVGTDVMEMVSLAARERLSEIFESLREIASIRTDSEKGNWRTQITGPNVYSRMKRMRQDEERTLQVGSEMRSKRLKEQKEQEAKKLAGESASADKKTKDSSAAAESDRKQRVALEKKRKEHSSHNDALIALVRSTDARRKKPAIKGLAPLESLSKKGLPPIPKLGSMNTASAGSSSKDRRVTDPHEKLNTLGPLVKLGRDNALHNKDMQPAAKPEVKRRLTLRDCIFLMERTPNTRKSSLVYKWYARLGTRDYK